MKKSYRKLTGAMPAFAVLAVLMLMAIMTGCAKKKTTPVVHAISYRYATAQEGAKLLLENEEYYAGFSQNDLDFKMQKTGAGMDEYLDFSGKQVKDFTAREQKLIDECFEEMEKTIADNNYTLPPLEEIVLIKTTMEEEPGAGAYTHGTQIYIGEQYLIHLARNPILEKDSFISLLWHELFHCLTRCNPDFREEMYSLIHFTVVEDDYKLPPTVFDYHISNPDVEHHNSYATFRIEGKDIDCFTDFVTTMHYSEAQSDFFSCGTTALIPTDGTDTYYTPEQADNFDEIFGMNTDYVIDPEECMADNFALAMHYGLDGEEGEGYNSPEIIEGILKYVSATPSN